jgi:alpha-beta hydrolase superfamily lysophospholipase
MYDRVSRLISLLLLALMLPLPAALAVGEATLLKQLSQPPFLAAVSMSRDGHFLSGLRRNEDVSELVVWYADAGLNEAEVLPYAFEDLSWMAWVGGGRLLLSLNEHGLVLYDAHLRRLRPLIDGEGPRPGDLPPVLLSSLPEDPRRILLQWEDPGVPGYPAVFRVDAVSGASEKIIGGWKPVIRWWASPQGEIILGEGFVARRHRLFAPRADGSWDMIRDRDYFDDDALAVLAVETGGATALVLSSHDSDTRALWRMDARSGDFMKRLAGHDRYDIVAAILDPETNLAVGATYEEDGIEDMVWAATHQDRIKDMAARAGVANLSLVAASVDGRRQLYRARLKHAPSRYFLYDAEVDLLNPLPYDPAEDALPTPETKGVWIDLPRGKGQMHALLSRAHTGRAVVLVHGGPVKRVTDSYNPFVSWLTANGYSVLQPNFRGSSGFGERWRRAGYAEWGHDMQDDVRTATEWLVDQNIARKGEICVVGGSYGGYAALMSSIKDDDLIGCAVSLNGVTSIELLIRHLEEGRFHMLTTPRIQGRLSKWALRRRSPVNRADLVRVPVLLLHSTNDMNVRFEHGQLMHTVLTRLEKVHKFIVLEGAEHQLKRAADKRIYYQSTLNFLDAHIGPGSQR